MNHLLDDDDLKPQSEREVTLSTAAILGIFFGLVLLCGFFFALGYNLHKPASTLAASTSADTSKEATPSAFDRFKPRAGSPDSGSARAATPVPSPELVTPPASPAHAPSPAVEPPAQPHEETAAPVAAPAPAAPAPAVSHNRAQPAAPAPPPAPVPVANGAFVVQIAAVSHHEDADLLVNALRQKGYTVASRTEPQDKLFHIQVGPFATHKEADQMRQRLLADGYNAIVK